MWKETECRRDYISKMAVSANLVGLVESSRRMHRGATFGYVRLAKKCLVAPGPFDALVIKSQKASVAQSVSTGKSSLSRRETECAEDSMTPEDWVRIPSDALG